MGRALLFVTSSFEVEPFICFRLVLIGAKLLEGPSSSLSNRLDSHGLSLRALSPHALSLHPLPFG